MNGVPNIFGETKNATWYGLGWAHAEDRLWQMAYQRFFAQGRLSETFGPSTVAIDQSMRLLRIPETAEKMVDTLSEEHRS